jgi:type II secretory pathway pseudopilin PulG
MREALKLINNEKGAVLVVALVIVGLLMVIGTSITMTSSIELNIARNEKVAQSAFYNAENARILAGRVIGAVFSGSSFNDDDNLDGNPDIILRDGDFPHESIPDGSTDAFSDATRDMELTGALEASVDVDKMDVSPVPGSSAEFAAGYEGTGTAGAVQIIYQINSEGRAAPNARSLVQVEYRMLPH